MITFSYKTFTSEDPPLIGFLQFPVKGFLLKNQAELKKLKYQQIGWIKFILGSQLIQCYSSSFLMGYRNDILDSLFTVLSKTYMDGRVYNIAGEKCKRLLFKNFFRKLSHQKRCFCKRIRYEIQVLENEIILLGGEVKTLEEKRREINKSVLPVIRVEREGLIKDCYRRERKNIEMFNNLLSKISSGNIREMLLFQKHSVQLILNEIESMGMRISDLKENEKGERNFI